MPRSLQRVGGRALDALAERLASRLRDHGVVTDDRANSTEPTNLDDANLGNAGTTIVLEYPVHPVPRQGWGAAQDRHDPIDRVLSAARSRIGSRVDEIVSLFDHLAAIPATADDEDPGPRWQNSWIPGLDGASLYTFVATRAPRTYLEVGSGNSTKFARRAVDDFRLETRIVSIDPMPRAEIDRICTEVVRDPLENTDLRRFANLEPGDVVFIDNSHCSYMNSDVTVSFLEVLPAIPAGVLIGFHDIFLPLDYPPDWSSRFYNEQYLLAMFLLGGHEGFDVEFPAFWVSLDADLAARFEPLWEQPGPHAAERHGGAFWLSRSTTS
jgi:hypothetical protein